MKHTILFYLLLPFLSFGQINDSKVQNIMCFQQADFVNLETESIVGSSLEQEFCIKLINKNLFELIINGQSQKIPLGETKRLEDMEFRGQILKVFKAMALIGLDEAALFYTDDGTGILNPSMLHIYNRYVKNINDEVLIQYRVN
jgi:hypothetical protein